MNLLEYQARELLHEYGIPVPRSVLVRTKADLKKIKDGMFGQRKGFVVKAQVTAGGRGKAGGVKLVSQAAQARKAAGAMIGAQLATLQTANSGIPIRAVLVAEKMEIQQELYLAVTLNRKKAAAVILASKHGGMDIEEIAKNDPKALVELEIDPWEGAARHRLWQLAGETLGLTGSAANSFIFIARRAAALFLERELSLLEINPLAVTGDTLCALDAKISFEENALFRQPANLKFVKELEKFLEPAERRAKTLGVAYIPIGGRIGCLVNGAGLAMATMDLISLHGETPANFLDVGGGANVAQVQGAFELLFSNKNLAAILVNIFGGIMRCDIIAEAMIAANKKITLKRPLVARLLGTNVDRARKLLEEAKLPHVKIFSDSDQAVREVCRLAKGNINGHTRG